MSRHLGEARSRIADAARFVETLGSGELDAAANSPVARELPTGMIFDMSGKQYVRDWALPQVAFHQLIAYVLR